MNEPSARARQLLDRYKAAAALPADEKARLDAVLQQRLLRGDLPRFDVQPGLPSAAHASLLERLWSAAWGKVGLGLVAVGAVGGGLYGLQSGGAAEPRPPVVSVAPALIAPPVAEAIASIAVKEAPGAPTEPRAFAPTPARLKPERTEPAPSASEPTIDEEVKLMNGAQAALRAGDSQRSLQLLREHRARFPTGKLATLRQVTHMMALCQAGQTTQARQEVSAFLAQNPDSPFAPRVQGICAPHD